MWNKILHFFSARSNDISEGLDVATLLKQATAEKESGNLNEAIETLRKAYDLISISGISYSVETFLKLPLYLQKAKRNDEAWREFNLLLTRGFPYQNTSLEIRSMNNSIIYDKMRLFLHREKKYELAVRFGLCSFMFWAEGLKRQERNDELEDYVSPENIEYNVENLLKKAKHLEVKELLIDFVRQEVGNLPKFDVGSFSREVDKIVFKK